MSGDELAIFPNIIATPTEDAKINCKAQLKNKKPH
jgi:hypothetical protein